MIDSKRELKDALKPIGRRATHKRALLLDLLRRIPGHPDAETLFIEAKKLDPRISLATVYRTLALLKKTGVIEEHLLGESHAHFEAVSPTPHFHFTCLKCGRVIEFRTALLDRLISELKQKNRVELQEIQIDARGLCARCREAKD